MALLKVLWWRSLIQGLVYVGEVRRYGQKAVCSSPNFGLPHIESNYVQVAVVTTQSILVGFLSTYFTKADPTSEDTRNAYLGATGMDSNAAGIYI